MTFLRKLFGGRKSSDIERIWSRASSDVDAVYGPLGSLGTSIVQAADSSHKTVSRAFSISLEGTPSKERIFVLYELLYFFCHMTLRAAMANGLKRPQVEKIQRYLGPLLASVSIDSFFQHWPQHLKEGMRNEFYENLNAAEGEYAVCAAIMSKDNPSSPDTILGKLARSVAMLLGREIDVEIVSIVLSAAMEELRGMDLNNRMKMVASVIDAVNLEDIPSA